MKKIVISMVLTLSLLCSIVVPAFAVTMEDGEAIVVDNYDEEGIQESTHSPMPYNVLTTIGTFSSGLMNNHTAAYSTQSYRYTDFPTKTLFYSCNLTTSGNGSTIRMGLGCYSDNLGAYYMEGADSVKMNLKDSTYAWPTLIKKGEKYKPCMENKTGGVVQGTASWYRVDRIS